MVGLRDLHLLVVLPERDDAAGRVRDVRDPGGVGLDAVHAGARQQVPHTQQPVLRQGGGGERGHETMVMMSLYQVTWDAEPAVTLLCLSRKSAVTGPAWPWSV